MVDVLRTPQPSSTAGSSLPHAVREEARAKVNLTLHVRGKRSDGYHELESLVAFADVYDEVLFDPEAADGVLIEGPFASAIDGENLILKAKRAVASWLDAEISGGFRLCKNIPVAAGLGGGSSDAAAAIRALLKAYGAPETALTRIIPLAAAIGADVPVCLHHQAAWMRGLGERVTPIGSFQPLPAVLVNPRIKLSTAEVFKALKAAPSGGGDETDAEPFSCNWQSPENAAECLLAGRNDLEAPSISLEPAVGRVLETLRSLDGCLLARLSGSGPTCFGLFPTCEAAQGAEAHLRQDNPAWWVMATALS